jgi:hypothetical protein
MLAAAVCGAAFAVGTVHTISLCIVTAVIAVAAVLTWSLAEPMKVRSAATLLLFTGIGLTVYTALQCVPMPIGWLAVIAPHNADVWSRALAPLHEQGPAWAPISLDPTATRVEVLRGVAYLLAFVTALRIARRRDGVRFLSAVIVLTALALALAAFLHPAFGAKKLFGLYEPSSGVNARHLAPLMNPNNLAGYINLAACLALASLLAPEPYVPRPIACAVVVLLATAQVWVASRSGVATMALGALIVIVIARVTRTRHSGTVPTATLVAGATMVLAAGLFVLSGSDETSNELLDSDVSKLKMFVASLRGIPAMPFFGCGRGAFESSFPAFRADPGYITFAYPENVVAQWVVEWGLPVGILGFVAIAFALRPNVVLARSSTAGGAWAGIAAVAVQNLGDLGTEIPGLMLACVVCAAIVAAGTPGSDPKWRVERWAGRPRWVAPALGLAAVVALALGADGLRSDLHGDQKALYRDAVDPGTSADRMHSVARAAMLRHPSEPYLPFVTALRAVHERDDDPMPWLAATLERARVYGPAHMVLARAVARHSPSQARLEYRLAMEQAPNLIKNVMTEAPRVVGGYYDGLELLPSGKQGVEVGELLVQAIGDRLPATRVRLDADLAARAPTAQGPLSRSAYDAVQDLEASGGAPWCQGASQETCTRNALAMANHLELLAPDACWGYILHARALAANGQANAGITELEKAAGLTVDRVSCLEQLVGIARQAGNEPRTVAALDQITTIGCRGETSCPEHLRWVANQYESMRKVHRAIGLYRRSLDLAADDDLLAHVAELAAKEGLHAEAAADYEQLARRHPDNDEWHQLATSQHDAAMREVTRL